MITKILTVTIFVLYLGRSSGKVITSPTADANTDSPLRLIIDTDAGGDDAVALLLALAAKDELQVLAITCTYGNTNETNVETNVLKILTVANRTDIPVYGGATKPMLENFTASDYFGKDGLGDFDFGREVKGAIDKSKHASVAMIELAQKHPGEISMLTLGPLTNVAMAASMDPSFTQNVKRFYVMGSLVNESDPKAPGVDFNFGLDPENDAVFLRSATKLKSLVTPSDVVHKSLISIEWRMQVLGRLGSQAMEFLNKAESVALSRWPEWWQAADAITVATMIWPELVNRTLEARIAALLCDAPRGAVIVDPRASSKNVEIIRDFDVEGFKNKLTRYLA